MIDAVEMVAPALEARLTFLVDQPGGLDADRAEQLLGGVVLDGPAGGLGQVKDNEFLNGAPLPTMRYNRLPFRRTLK